MRVYFTNVEGFKGEHSFTLNHQLNVITSKFNGVGKTTLFNCLKIITGTEIPSKDRIQFVVNMDAKEGRFTVQLEDVIYGFISDKKKITYIRKYPDQGVERSLEPFPEVSEDIGILNFNGYPVNVQDMNLDLITGDDLKRNSQLVDALLTEANLVKFKEHAYQNKELKKEQLKAEDKKYFLLLTELQALQFFPRIDEFQEEVKNYQAAEFHDGIEDMIETLKRTVIEKPKVTPTQLDETLLKIQHIPFIDGQSEIQLDQTSETLVQLSNIQFIKPKRSIYTSTTLEPLTSIQQLTQRLHLEKKRISEEKVEETLLALQTNLNNLVPQNQKVQNPKDCLEALKTLQLLGNSFKEEKERIPDSEIDLLQIQGTINRLVDTAPIKQAIKEIRDSIKEFEFECPLYGTVYTVEGKCSNAHSVSTTNR